MRLLSLLAILLLSSLVKPWGALPQRPSKFFVAELGRPAELPSARWASGSLKASARSYGKEEEELKEKHQHLAEERRR